MLRPARWRNDATEATRLERACDLPGGFPEVFRVLEGLAGDDYVRAFWLNFLPVVWIGQDNVDVRSSRQIYADIFPRRQGEERPVRAVDVLTPEIQNDQLL